MDKEIVDNIDKYYRAARSIAGELGDDLLHSFLINFKNKRRLKGDDLYRYVKRGLKNEFINNRSSFCKEYGIREEIVIEESCDGYDGIQINEILSSLKKEGHEHKVNLFLDVMYKRTTVKQIATEMNVSRMYVYRNYITFIRKQIKERYEH